MEKHYTVIVNIKEVTKTGDRSDYDNNVRRTVIIPGERKTDDVLSLTIRADDLGSAISKVIDHLYAEQPPSTIETPYSDATPLPVRIVNDIDALKPSIRIGDA